MEKEKIITGGDTAEANNHKADQETESLTLKFLKPYTFENKTYEELDLTGLEDTTAIDLAAAGKAVAKAGIVTPMPEMTVDFCVSIAARVCKLPIEFFQGLPAREALRLKNVVTGFLYGGDGEN